MVLVNFSCILSSIGFQFWDELSAIRYSDNDMVLDVSNKNSHAEDTPTKFQDKQKLPANWKQRVKFGVMLVSAFSLIVYQGSLALAASIFAVQVMCYHEMLNIGYIINNSPRLPRFKITVWYFFFVWNYILIGETFGENFKHFFQQNFYLSFVFNHSRFKGFCLYFSGIILFVISLAGKYDIKRFRLLAVLHVLLLVISLPSYLLIKCLFEGLIWAVIPLCSVILNDIFAYLFGKLIGRTPLIHLSPKKTWEGFIGGIFGTLITTLLISSVLCNLKYFICPTEYNKNSHIIEINTECDPIFSFQPVEYIIFPKYGFRFYPFMIDSFYIALFASVIAPFAGFFASGFKRAFNLKDFSNTIPGHGGILDRFDCQFLMSIFVFVYMSTFVKNSKLKKLYRKILTLSEYDQMIFYDLLKVSLEEGNIL